MISGQLQVFGVLRRAARSVRQTPLLQAQHSLSSNNVHGSSLALGGSFSCDNRRFSTSDTASSALELTVTHGQLTAAVVGSGTGQEHWAIVQGVQAALETVHMTTGLPWWATLMLSGVALRAAIFPFYVYQIQATQRLMKGSSDFRKLHSAYKYARTFTPVSDHKRHLNAMLLWRQGVRAVIKKYNTRPIQTVIGAVAYIPIFIVMAYSARDMVRCGNFAGLDTGGLFFWKNLMETDSTYMLPALAALSTYGNLEVSARTKSGFWTELLRAGQYGTILAVPFLANLPQGVFFYWLGSSWSSMAQSIAMNNNNFRRCIGLKPRIMKIKSTI
ncbi:unnamed protein product [Peronospora belbahrii]|uniref:Membrane insertase YidC/Oxa/ALB C-terminal domain-containing protein n=1 Tax=Peronospora belbahrii TaxID=622444 RepID=A0AAU9LB39_9STRA|nr:unnamed protein product [Peronospora belbahrii]CAH0522384.1 unnamed protein product [Peronospora belbahrii]